MYERDSQVLGRETEALRTAAVEKGERWTAGQAARLDTSPEVILEAIRRGPWLPEQIEQVRSKYALESGPPQLEGVELWIDQEIDRKSRAKARRAKAMEETVMSAAFKQAAE